MTMWTRVTYKKNTGSPSLTFKRCDVLLLAGMKSKNIADTEALHRWRTEENDNRVRVGDGDGGDGGGED